MKIKIISDGNGINTRVVDAETGEELRGATAIEWSCKTGELAKVKLELINIEVEVIADLKQEDIEYIDITALGKQWKEFEYGLKGKNDPRFIDIPIEDIE